MKVVYTLLFDSGVSMGGRVVHHFSVGGELTVQARPLLTILSAQSTWPEHGGARESEMQMAGPGQVSLHSSGL